MAGPGSQRRPPYPVTLTAAPSCCTAVQSVKTAGSDGKARYPVKAINVLKAHGKSAKESRLLGGYALNLGRAAQVGQGVGLPLNSAFLICKPGARGTG